jgi:transketolase
MEICKRVHANNIVAWAKNRPEALVLSADLTSSTEIDQFRDAYPDRFISCGIAEQNMMSVAGGLAREGFIPLVHTFAVFIYRRAFDQVAMSIAYPNLPVKMFGFLPGLTTPGGATHQAIEDLALMRALPNMTVLECGDATEVEGVLDAAFSVPGPVYVRMLRGEIPRLFPQNEPMTIDRPRVLAQGGDVVVVSSGICTEEAMKAVAFMHTKGASVGLVHVSSLKPFDNDIVPRLIARARYGIVTVENHSINGGLGSVVCETMVRHEIKAPLVRLGLADCFAHGASREFLMAKYGIDAFSIVRSVEGLSGTDFRINREDLASVHPNPGAIDSKAEDL